MSKKKIGFIVFAALAGTLAVSWTHLTGHAAKTAQLSTRTDVPIELRLNVDTAKLPVQKFDDMTFVYSGND